MRFTNGQKVVCVSDRSEWELVVPDFNEMLKIALKVKLVPIKGDICTVASNLELHYKGKTYIRVNEYPAYIFAEDGFVEIGNEVKIISNESQDLEQAFTKVDLLK